LQRLEIGRDLRYTTLGPGNCSTRTYSGRFIMTLRICRLAAGASLVLVGLLFTLAVVAT
jgi:hypothetical protein